MISLKLIELQVALPRTQDVGKMQEQLQQKGQISQDHLASAMLKEQEKRRKQVNENEKSAQNKLKNDSSSEENSTYGGKRKIPNQDEETQQQHPYKGTFLDIEG